MPQAVIAFGGNQTSTAEAIGNALKELRQLSDVQVLATSSLYGSAPMGTDAGDYFLNGACVIDTTRAPIELLDMLQRIETDNGRVRETHWGPRTLDLDLIFHGDQSVASDRLTIPHPHCWYRRFVLDPVAQVAPDWKHPAIGLTVRELRDRLHAPDFHVTVCGNVEVDLTREFRFEFRDVSFEQVEDATRPPARGIGILVSAEHQVVAPLWLQTTPTGLKPFLRDVLIAARGECRQLPPE